MEQEIPSISQHSIMLKKLHASKRNGNTRPLVASRSTRKGVSDLLLGYTLSTTFGCVTTLCTCWRICCNSGLTVCLNQD